jgi:hypothetical protein
MGTLYDRQIDSGNGQVGMTQIPLDGSDVHVTQYEPVNNTRTSWDTNGATDGDWGRHYTDQNVPKGHPGRHG